MKLHRDLEITQKSTWFLTHRLRESYDDFADCFEGPVEVDKTNIGGKERNKHASKKLHARRSGVGEQAAIGAKDRASKIDSTDKQILHGFVGSPAHPDSTVYTDDHRGYMGLLYKDETIKYSVSQYVNDQAHTNGIESFWVVLKRGYQSAFHHMSEKHLNRYVGKFAGWYN